MRSCALRYALSAMTVQETVDDWIIDDTGFPEAGEQVAPACSASTAARFWKDEANLVEIGVSVTIATPTLHLPIDMDLYLPRSWTDDRARCRAAHIPDDVGYPAQVANCARPAFGATSRPASPVGLMLADSGYGDVGDFRAGVRATGASTTRWT